MARKIKSVTISVHPNFFDGWFEPTRRRYERKIGKPISQVKFTGIIADNFKMGGKNTFFPKNPRGFKFRAL